MSRSSRVQIWISGTRIEKDWKPPPIFTIAMPPFARLSRLWATAQDAIDALALTLEGFYAQAHLLAQLPAHEPGHAVCLPAGRLHDGFQRRARGLLEQRDYSGRLASFAPHGPGFAAGLLPRTPLPRRHGRPVC